ncbi:MAG: hypothetical protein AB1921_16025 [Thermodesulfobacteriota bacterium]
MTSLSTTTDINVFFSWQSDLPDETNRRLIRECLRSASSFIEGKFKEKNIRIIIDEATRGLPGSPDITLAILNKISKSDVLVCDITTINRGAPNGVRKVPNPNVIFELGFGVSILGWGRIILLFNTAFGSFPQDTPFDIDRHRASPYSFEVIPEGQKLTKAQKEERKRGLYDTLVDALSQIIIKMPDKPIYNETISIENKRRRDRDVENIKWLFTSIHLPTIDNHIIDSPHKMHGRLLHFWEEFNSIVSSSHFYLYDSELLKLVKDMHSMWGKSMSYGHRYYSDSSVERFYFQNRPNQPFSDDEKKDWDDIQVAVDNLATIFKSLLSYIRTNYLELNIDELSEATWNNYLAHLKEVDALAKEEE